MLAALDSLVQRSTVRSRIDAGRLGVMGHSMGGGDTLEAEIRTPTLVVGADGDTIAPVATHSQPFYISWLKRFIDNDTRCEQFLCPLPAVSLTIAESRGNCPHTS